MYNAIPNLNVLGESVLLYLLFSLFFNSCEYKEKKEVSSLCEQFVMYVYCLTCFILMSNKCIWLIKRLRGFMDLCNILTKGLSFLLYCAILIYSVGMNFFFFSLIINWMIANHTVTGKKFCFLTEHCFCML